MAGWLPALRALDLAASRAASRGELDRRFDELVEAYAAASESERRRLRAAYVGCETWGQHPHLLGTPSFSQRFEQQGDIADLRRMLAHYSMSDGWPDARDAVVGMSLLSATARKHGIDPSPVFEEIGRLTNREDCGIGPLADYFSVTR